MPEGGFYTEFAVGPELRSKTAPRTLPSRHERLWVGAVMIATDIVILEFCLYLGFVLRTFLAQWFPIDLVPSVYAGISAGLPLVTLCFYFMGLYPGYGISDVERLKQQQCGIAIIFSSLIIWDYLAQETSLRRNPDKGKIPG